MLSLDRLRFLVEVDRRGSIGAAAKAMHLTPSAISQQLKALARAVGTEVVETSPAGSRCTPAGRILVDHAMRAIAELDLAEEAVRSLGVRRTGELRLACFPSVVGSVLPAVLVGLSREYPDVRVMFDVMRSQECLDRLLTGAADAALMARYPQDSPLSAELRCSDLASDETCLLIAAGHRLASREKIPLSELSGEPLLLEGENSPSSLAFLDVCRMAGVIPLVRAYSPDPRVAAAMVAEGVGHAVVPRLALPQPLTGAVARGLESPVTRTIVLVSKQHKAGLPVMRALLKYARAACQEATGASPT
ncbi:LysR family transcriptional regulator [Streptomyces malaysiensis]|uniref:LysR family transcriptional regulator n=1 Tax=Streptomyces malaysiensis TaxID=92644 RepID=UPI0037147946